MVTVLRDRKQILSCKATNAPQKQAAAVIKCKRTIPFPLLNPIQPQPLLKLKKEKTLQNVLHKFCCPRSLHSQSKGSKYLKKPDPYRISSSHFQISAITREADRIALDRSPPPQQLHVQIRRVPEPFIGIVQCFPAKSGQGKASQQQQHENNCNLFNFYF